MPERISIVLRGPMMDGRGSLVDVGGLLVDACESLVDVPGASPWMLVDARWMLITN